MTTLYIFASTFALVFALGFQSLNVNNGHYIAAFFTSFAIGLSNLVLFKTVPQAGGIEIAAFLMGGPFGIIASMWAHRRWMKKAPAKVQGYEYGAIGNGTPARRNIKTGEVQFMLWKPGEQGHKDGFWHRVGDGWEQTFKTEKEKFQPSRITADELNKRAEVESILLNVYAGKRPLLTREECKALAFRLGVPSEYQRPEWLLPLEGQS